MAKSASPPELAARCAMCRFWWTANPDRDRGLCRRYPPSIFLRSIEGETLVTQTEFPILLATGWCGEFVSNNRAAKRRKGGAT